jgi:hypothetical protein
MSRMWRDIAAQVESSRAKLLRGYYSQRPGRRDAFLRRQERRMRHVGAMALGVLAERARVENAIERELREAREAAE